MRDPGWESQIECDEREEIYIGESGRPLKFRLDEHHRALENAASYPYEAFSTAQDPEAHNGTTTIAESKDSAPLPDEYLGKEDNGSYWDKKKEARNKYKGGDARLFTTSIVRRK